jgi:hypothetical protein
MINYNKGRSYSWKLNRFLYQDILHDAYVNYYKSKGRNLFEEEIKTVIRTIKLTYYGYYINRNFVRNRVECIETFEDQYQNEITPEQQFIESEELENLIIKIKHNYPRTSDNMLESLDLKLSGYDQQEIAEKLGSPKSLITYYFSNIRKMYINNPFAGSRVKLSKKITRKTYEEKYKDEYVYDPERDCDYNEFFTIVTNGTNYILVKENGKD